MPATERLEFRVESEVKSRLEEAADLVHESLGKFVREAAEERANAVLAAERETYVSPAFFNELFAALDEPVQRNEALTKAARKLDELVVSE